jgi:hypothetical protein
MAEASVIPGFCEVKGLDTRAGAGEHQVMKFDSLSRIFLVAAVAAAFPLSAKADGNKPAPAPRPHAQPGEQRELSVDGQKPPRPAPKDGPKQRHKRKLPPHRPPPPGPKPTPPGG